MHQALRQKVQQVRLFLKRVNKHICLFGMAIFLQSSKLQMDKNDLFIAPSKLIFLFGVCVLIQPAEIYYPGWCMMLIWQEAMCTLQAPWFIYLASRAVMCCVFLFQIKSSSRVWFCSRWIWVVREMVEKRWILTQRYIYSQANRTILHGHAWIKSFSHFNDIIPPINKNQALLSLCDDTVAVLETRNYLDMLEA